MHKRRNPILSALSIVPSVAITLGNMIAIGKTYVALSNLGCKQEEIEKLDRFLIRLAKRTFALDSEFVRLGMQFALSQVKQGKPLIPLEVGDWLCEFWGDGGAREAIERGLRKTGRRPNPNLLAISLASLVGDGRRIWDDMKQEHIK